MTIEQFTSAFEANQPELIKDGFEIQCPFCELWSVHTKWEFTGIYCESCDGDHDVTICPSCDEFFDYIFCEPFNIR